MAVERTQLPQTMLEAMALDFLQAYPKCLEARSVVLRRLTDARENGANRTLESFDSGISRVEECQAAMKVIIPVIQHHFDLAPDA